tara:strand:- start:14092 stop:14580 length:489 start_codon:yes stop_codon:yes gene_type:complete
MPRTLVLTPSVGVRPENPEDSLALVLSTLIGFLMDPVELSQVNRDLAGIKPVRARAFQPPAVLRMLGEMDRFYRRIPHLSPERRIGRALSLDERDQVLREYQAMNLSAPCVWASWKEAFEEVMDTANVGSIRIALPVGSPICRLESFSPRVTISILQQDSLC